jgi:hypothetical protein
LVKIGVGVNVWIGVKEEVLVKVSVGVVDGVGVDEGSEVEVLAWVAVIPLPTTETLSIYQPEPAFPLSLARRKRRMTVWPE